MKKITLLLVIILISFLLLGCVKKQTSTVFVPSDEKCYVVVDSSKDINPSLLSNISISLISKFVRDVEQLPPSGISSDSCQYQISVSKNNDTTFVTFKGEGLNSYGDSKLTGSDGFQQSILKSLYRSLKDKRDIICQDYGTLLEECGGVIVEKRHSGILFGTFSSTKWEDGGEWKWYKNDDEDRYGRYKGEIENGIPNGKGVVKTIDKQKYDGEWKNGRRHGQGTYTHFNGEKYVGEFKDGKRNGQGTITYSDGEKYVGEWKDGKRTGQGTMTQPDGTKYVGKFKDGLPNGKGVFTFGKGKWEGDKYIGEHKDGKKHGQGIYTFTDGRKYEGEWKDGEYNGQGTLTLFNGDKYEGEWKDGKPNGQGTTTLLDGGKYVGEWKNGMVWNGKQYDKNGTIIRKYMNGK